MLLRILLCLQIAFEVYFAQARKCLFFFGKEWNKWTIPVRRLLRTTSNTNQMKCKSKCTVIVTPPPPFLLHHHTGCQRMTIRRTNWKTSGKITTCETGSKLTFSGRDLCGRGLRDFYNTVMVLAKKCRVCVCVCACVCRRSYAVIRDALVPGHTIPSINKHIDSGSTLAWHRLDFNLSPPN